jgi:thiol:disulfide interchange protein DsbA
MKRTWLLLSVLLCTTIAVAAEPGTPAGASAAFEAGKHYKVVKPPQPTETDGRIEVLEVFSYGCGHCNEFEPMVSAWAKQRADKIQFRKLALPLKETWAPLAKAFYAAEALNAVEKTNAELFKAIHTDKQKLFDEASIADFYAGHGVNKDEFTKAYRSFTVDGKIRKAMQLAGKYGVDGVPTLVINGEFVTTGSMAGGYDGMLKVADYLIAQGAQQKTESAK